MKKLKARFGLLAASLGLASVPLYAATTVTNIPVVHGAWTFIGVPGFQNFGASSSTQAAWGDSAVRIIDGVGALYQVSDLEVPTWDGNVSDAVSTTTESAINDSSTPRQVDLGAGVGSDIYGTVAVMTLGQDTTNFISSDTEHFGATITALEWTPKVKVTTGSIRTMYIKSPDAGAPDIKIMYQADHEGDTFLIQYETGAATALTESDNTTYEGTFNREYTYDNAAVLGTDFAVSVVDTSLSGGNSVSKIMHAFDMNLANNEMNGTTRGEIEPNTVFETFNGSSYPYTGTSPSLRNDLDGNMTVLRWSAAAQIWEQFRASYDGTTATTSSANDFDEFEQGRGYWVKVDRDQGASFAAPSGFVLGYDSAANIDHTAIEDGISDGWNMLSFGDEYFAYSVTGMFLTGNHADLNITDTYGATRVNFTDINATIAPAVSCKTINASLDSKNSIGYTNFNLRCIPSQGTGIALISTRRFTAQTGGTAPTALDGSGSLVALADGTASVPNVYRSDYGTKAVVIEPNMYYKSVTTVDGNISVEFPLNSVGAAYAAVGATTATNITNVGTAMTTAAAGLHTDVATRVLNLDMDFDDVANDPGDALLLASNFRFFVKDATLVRTFAYDSTRADSTRTNAGSADNYTSDNNTTARVIGATTTTLIRIVDDNLTGTAARIDAVAGTTDVNATKMEGDEDNTTIMVHYTGSQVAANSRIAKVDLQEQGYLWDVLTEVRCSAYPTTITDGTGECNASTRGAIGKVWDISALVNFTKDSNTTNGFDGNYSGEFTSMVTQDLRNAPAFAQNFPISGPLFDIKTTYGKQAELIITGQTEATDATNMAGFVSWKQIDVSKDPTEWYDNDDQYELFWTEKEKGYWVYLNGTATNDLSFVGTPTISGTPYSHFNNYFSGTSTSATTQNQLNHTLTVEVSGVTTYGQATANNDAFEVYADINGYTTSFQRTGSTNNFTIPLNSHETAGLDFDAGEVTITITTAEASGKVTSTTYSLDYAKPVISAVSLSSSTASVTITNGTTAAEEIHVYTGDINDSNYGTSVATNWGGSVTVSGDTTAVNLGSLGIVFPSAFTSITGLDVTAYDSAPEQLAQGIVKDMRFTAKDAGDLYSNQEKLGYIPFYASSGILASSSSTTYDSNPKVYDANGALDSAYTGTTGGANDGVQLKSASTATLTCAYAHNEVELNEAVANLRDIVLSDGTMIGTIMYMNDYNDQPFICQTSGSLYVGVFLEDGALNTGNAQATSQRIIVNQVLGATSTVAK